MEENIFEGAQLGTKFLRKDGKIAICCNHNDASTILWAEGEYEPYEYQNDRNGLTDDSPSIDIVSRYQEEFIDEETLDKIARKYVLSMAGIMEYFDTPEKIPDTLKLAINMFKAGYQYKVIKK